MKNCLFVFNGEVLCFVHVLLNALDMKEKGHEAAIVMEGQSVTVVAKIADPANPFHGLWTKAKEAGLITGACKACSAKLGAMEAVQAEGLTLLGDMSGHPSIAKFQEDGYTVITF